MSACEPVPHIPKSNFHQQKILLCIWWTTVGVTYYELLNYVQIITFDIYSKQHQRVKDELKLLRKQPSVLETASKSKRRCFFKLTRVHIRLETN